MNIYKFLRENKDFLLWAQELYKVLSKESVDQYIFRENISTSKTESTYMYSQNNQTYKSRDLKDILKYCQEQSENSYIQAFCKIINGLRKERELKTILKSIIFEEPSVIIKYKKVGKVIIENNLKSDYSLYGRLDMIKKHIICAIENRPLLF